LKTFEIASVTFRFYYSMAIIAFFPNFSTENRKNSKYFIIND